MDISNASLKCWRFVISVTGYMHGWPTACSYLTVNGFTNPDPGSASTVYKAARWRLGPRHRFLMSVGCTDPNDVFSGKLLFDAKPMTTVTTPNDLTPGGLTDFDVEDGPRCLQFDVVHVMADNIFKVEAVFEISKLQCDDDDEAPDNTNGILSHRWTCVDSLDANLRTVRTYHGMLEIATSQFSPHWFRDLVVPPLQEGMRREHIQFLATEDGRKLQYTITDQSVAYSAPAPATRWSVQHTVGSINQDDMPTTTAQISVSLEAPEDVDKGDLIILGLYIVSAKLQGSKPGENPVDARPIFMNDITITDFTGDSNIVQVAASCRRLAQVFKNDGADPKGLAIDVEGLNKIIAAVDLPAFSANYNPVQSNGGRAGEAPYYEGPVALSGIFRCYLQSNCSGATGINIRTNQLASTYNQVNPDNEPVQTVTARTTPTIEADYPSYFSTSHETSMYTTYQMESVYKTNAMRVALPIASVPYGGGGIDVSDAAAILSLSRPQCRRVVRILAERVGDWPEFPDPESMESGQATVYSGGITPIVQKMLDSKLLGGTQTYTCNGEQVYRARLETTFALSRAPTPPELLKMGQNKWSSSDPAASTTTLTNSTFS